MKQIIIVLGLTIFISGNAFSQIEIDAAGNAGIGTATPTEKLDVDGKLRVRDVTNDNTKDSVLVVSGDGTVSYRDASTLGAEGCGFSIGDSTAGGIIFYLDASGCHGLVCAITDQSTGIQWYNGSSINTNSIESGIGIGKGNTQSIISFQGSGSYAATVCMGYMGGGFSNWYLPSKYELNMMYINKAVINAMAIAKGGTAFGFSYWSSTEKDSGIAWQQDFLLSFQNNFPKVDSYHVRAVRAF